MKKTTTKGKNGKKKTPYARNKSSLQLNKLAELKSWDISNLISGILPSTTAGGNVVSIISAPQLGTDFMNRIGRKIQATSLHLKGWFSWTDAGAHIENQPLLCMAVVLDRQPNGTGTPIMNDIWAGTNGATSGNGLLVNNLNNRKRFKILHRWQSTTPFVVCAAAPSSITAATTAVVDSQGGPYQFDVHIDLLKHKMGPTIFNAGNASAYADINENALSLWFWIGLTSAINSSGCIDVEYYTRMRFYDC